MVVFKYGQYKHRIFATAARLVVAGCQAPKCLLSQSVAGSIPDLRYVYSVERPMIRRLQYLILDSCFQRACRAIECIIVLEQPFLPDAIHHATNLLSGYPLGGWENTITNHTPRKRISDEHLCRIDWIPTQRAGSTPIQGVYFLHLVVG